MVNKKRIHYSYEDGIENPPLMITVCHHSPSLVMPIGDPRDGFFCPTLTLIICVFPGMVGITLSHINGMPKDADRVADSEAVNRYNQFSVGWWANPIFGDGDYPDVMKWQIGNKSLEQGLNSSRLPEFTDTQRRLLKGTNGICGLIKF